MTITLNIGSAIDGKNKALSISTVFNRLEASGIFPFQFRTAQSETETTYVIQAELKDHATFSLIHRLVYDISDGLQQDCIAWTYQSPKWPEVSYSGLSGPRADEWGGKFSAEHFIQW